MGMRAALKKRTDLNGAPSVGPYGTTRQCVRVNRWMTHGLHSADEKRRGLRLSRQSPPYI